MSNHYFENFGKISYNGYNCTNILARPKILKRVSKNPWAFYPYQMKQGDRADTIAEGYYGSFFYSWVVYLSGNVIDPYYGMMMTQQIFNEFITEKYGSYALANRQVVMYRVNWDADPSVILPNDYDQLQDYEKKYWSPMFVGQNIVSYDRAQVPWVSQTNFYQTVTTENMTIFNVGDCVSNQLNGLIVGTGQIAINNGAALVLEHINGNILRYIQYEFLSGTYLSNGESANVANTTFAVTGNVISSNGSTIIVSFDGTYPVGNVTITGSVSGNITLTQNVAPLISNLVADLTSGNTSAMITSDYNSACIPMEELAYWEPWYSFEKEDERNSALQSIRLLDVVYRNQTLAELIKLMSL